MQSLTQLLLRARQAEGAEGCLAAGETDQRVARSHADPLQLSWRGMRPNN